MRLVSMKKPHQLRRRGPDYITEELATVLASDEWFEFKALFTLVHANLRARNVASNGDAEMLRLRAYEKLQNLVQRGVVEKSAKEYRGVPKALAAFTERQAAEHCRDLLSVVSKAAANTDSPDPQKSL